MSPLSDSDTEMKRPTNAQDSTANSSLKNGADWALRFPKLPVLPPPDTFSYPIILLVRILGSV